VVSSKIPIILIGCGQMGKRHIRGIFELRRAGLIDARLVAVLDTAYEKTGEAAELAECLLGERPRRLASLAEAEKTVEFEAADICTDPASHHSIASHLLERGVGCMVEKPLSPTVRGCRLMLEAARKGSAVLAVAENYRRDPVNRLARWLISNGRLGGWISALQLVVGGGDNLLLSHWRHKRSEGILIDLCCHYTDIFLYYFGVPKKVVACSTLLRETRFERRWNSHGVVKSLLKAEAEDFLNANYSYSGGRVASMYVNLAAAGEGIWRRMIYLEDGSIDVPMERTGQPVKVSRPSDQDYLSLLPHTIFTGQRQGEPYKLTLDESDIVYDLETRLLFRGLLNGYAMDFWEADGKLIALELLDFLRSVQGYSQPETSGVEGTLSVAMLMAALESAYTGRELSIDEILELKVEALQGRINRELGLALGEEV